jgi:hypothetical protein
MIKGISQGGRYITVLGGSPSSNYVNNYSSASIGVGNMRFNTSNQNIEVWDGNTWITLQNSYATVQLDEEAIRILDWAKKEMIKEIEFEILAKDHPAVSVAYENARRAKEQLELISILAKKEYDTKKTTS